MLLLHSRPKSNLSCMHACMQQIIHYYIRIGILNRVVKEKWMAVWNQTDLPLYSTRREGIWEGSV
jgi:hypothetical protein